MVTVSAPSRHSDVCDAAADDFAELGWNVLRIGAGNGRLPQVQVGFVLAHARYGVALVDLAPASSPDSVERLWRRLEAIGFADACPGHLPIIHKTLEIEDLWRLSLVMDLPFAGRPALSQEGSGWIELVQKALLLDDAPSPAAPVDEPGPEPFQEQPPEVHMEIAPEAPEAAPSAPDLQAIPMAREADGSILPRPEDGPARGGENLREAAVEGAGPSDSEPLARRRARTSAWMLVAVAGAAAVGLSHHFVFPEAWTRIGTAWRGELAALGAAFVSFAPASDPPASSSLAAPPSEAVAEPASKPTETIEEPCPGSSSSSPCGAVSPAGAALAEEALPGPTVPALPEAAPPNRATAEQRPGPADSAAEAGSLGRDPGLILPPIEPAGVPAPAEQVAAAPSPDTQVATVGSLDPAAPVEPPAPAAVPAEPEASEPAMPAFPAAAVEALKPLAPVVLAEPALPAPRAVDEPPVPRIEAEPAPLPRPGVPVVATPPAGPAALSPDVIALLVSRGDEMLARGDISGARLLYGRAAAAGNGQAYLAMGRSFDPDVLNRLGVRGIRPDPEEAREWYRRAEEAR